jgi:Cu-Zn family superoxide dismutase
MNGKLSWYGATLIGAAALLVGCGPDATDRDAASQSRPGDSALSRNESAEAPAANREIRPPSTTTSPAAPGAAATPPAAPRLMARAEVRPIGDHTVRGVVEFLKPADDGGAAAAPLTIRVMLMGLDAGPHGFHVHDGADCMAPGEHLNPLNAPHGAANASTAARHLGDLGNLTADAAGMVEETLRDNLLAGDTSFIGKVLVVHADQDDLSTQPDGGSGDPVGCGVIEAAGEEVLSRGDDANRGV